VSATATSTGDLVVHRSRPAIGLLLLLLAQVVGASGFLLTHLDIDGNLPRSWPYVLAAWFAVGLVTHFLVRWRLPYADPVLLPATFLLVGLGLAMIHRIDLIAEPARTDAQTQSLWAVLGVVGALAVIFLVKDYRILRRFPYLLFLAGLVLLLLPLTPLGVELNGSRIWIRVFGYSFQPAEVAKLVLSLAFAGYLADTKDVLAMAGPKVLGFTLPRARDLGPIAVMWVASMLVLIYQKDLGTSMLFFGLFVAMVYLATGRASWVVIGGLLFAAGGWFAYQRFAYVGVRVSSWLNPFSDFDKNFQIIQAQFGFAYGGLLGRGWGLGRPGLTPLAKSDFITAAVGEELGVIGLVAVILVYGIIVARGLRTALSCTEPFGKLLSAGLSLVFALQVFAIIGGVTRLLPLTGLTTPFMSQGGSSMVANWLVMAVMLVVSHDARRPAVVRVEQADVASLSADATQVINLRDMTPPSALLPSGSGRRTSQAPRPEPRTASSGDSPVEVEPPARALPDEADTEATAAFTPGDAPSSSTVTRPITTDPDEPTQQYRFDQEEL
jgi:cell division protein FtsW (lipid II flippase)